MADHFLFADEAGCFEFSNKQNVSRYFILATVSMKDCAVGDALVALRRRLAFDGMPIGDYFHACTDRQVVRDEVFKVICKYDFTIHATLLEKCKAQPQLRTTRARFYQHGWYFHMKHGPAKSIPKDAKLMVVAAALGNKNEKDAFSRAIDDVMSQTLPNVEHRANFCPCSVDPCLSVADYCAWAIQRRWESPNKRDTRSYNLIADRIKREFDLFEPGRVRYY